VNNRPILSLVGREALVVASVVMHAVLARQKRTINHTSVGVLLCPK